MRGLDPRIPLGLARQCQTKRDCRDKPGNDEAGPIQTEAASIHGAEAFRTRIDARAKPLSMGATIGLFLLASLILSWPWLSGAVTIPWDAKSQFLPELYFLAGALAHGESPLWTPNVFAGWPQISDPQSLIFSPLHLVLAWLDSAPGFRLVDGVTFAYLMIGGVGVILFFRDRNWHPAAALVA